MHNLNIFNELSEHISLKLSSCVLCAHEKYWQDIKIHSDYDLWYMKDGEAYITVCDKNYHIKAGDFVLFYPKIKYTSYTLAKPCELIYAHFDFAIGNNPNILDDFNFTGIISGDFLGNSPEEFVNAYKAYEQKEPMSVLGLKGTLMTVMSRYIPNINKHGTIFHISEKNSNALQLAQLRPVFYYVDIHINKKITVAELAARVNLSEKYFINLFKNAVGISPMQYVTQMKMNKAKQYIYENKYNVKQLADLLGYSDPYSFSRTFKKHFNVPPSRFK